MLVFVQRKDQVGHEEEQGLVDGAQSHVLGQSVRHEAVAEDVADGHDALVARRVRHSDGNPHFPLLFDLRRFGRDFVQLLGVVQGRLFHFLLQRFQRPVRPGMADESHQLRQEILVQVEGHFRDGQRLVGQAILLQQIGPVGQLSVVLLHFDQNVAPDRADRVQQLQEMGLDLFALLDGHHQPVLHRFELVFQTDQPLHVLDGAGRQEEEAVVAARAVRVGHDRIARQAPARPPVFLNK